MAAAGGESDCEALLKRGEPAAQLLLPRAAATASETAAATASAAAASRSASGSFPRSALGAWASSPPFLLLPKSPRHNQPPKLPTPFCAELSVGAVSLLAACASCRRHSLAAPPPPPPATRGNLALDVLTPFVSWSNRARIIVMSSVRVCVSASSNQRTPIQSEQRDRPRPAERHREVEGVTGGAFAHIELEPALERFGDDGVASVERTLKAHHLNDNADGRGGVQLSVASACEENNTAERRGWWEHLLQARECMLRRRESVHAQAHAARR
jgi:hypothetical protein